MQLGTSARPGAASPEMQPSNLRKQLRRTVLAWNPMQLGRCQSSASLSRGFAGCKVSGPFRDRPLVHRRRDCARPSVLFPGRLRTGGHILPLSCPSASLSAVCGTVSAVKSRWQRKICARQIPKRCGRTLRKQVWVSAWTSNLPCFKPRTYAHSVHSALSSGLHPQLCSGFAFRRPAGQKMLASHRAISRLQRRPQRLKVPKILKQL